MQRNAFSRTGFALTASWCSALATQLVTDSVCYSLLPHFYCSPSYYWVMYVISVYIVSVPLFVILCGGRGVLRPTDRKMKITFKDFLRLIIVCISLTYVFDIVGIFVNAKISELVGHPVVNPLQALDNTNKVLMFLCSGIISPFTEEIMFRGVMLKKLRPYGDKLAVWFTAVAFGLYHGNFSQFFYAAALGFVFASIAVKTNRLIYTILLHIAVNVSGSFIIPRIVGAENNLIALLGAAVLFVIIVCGIILGVKMLPHLKTGERFKTGDLKLMLINPGSACYIVLCVFMFSFAILRQ